MKSPVIVTGGSGFIGRAIIRQLNERKIAALNLDIRPPDDLHDHEVFYPIDLRSLDQITAFFKDLDHYEILACFYLAAYYDFSNRAHKDYAALQNGLQHFIQEFRSLKTLPFVYASSMAALAPGCGLTPESPRSSAWAYPASKVKAEEFLETVAEELPVIELVLAAVYSDWGELVPLYMNIERIQKSFLERHFFPAPLDRGLTYVHCEDVAKAFLKTLDRDWQTKKHRYLIGEEELLDYQSFHQIVTSALFKRSRRLFRIPSWFAWLGAVFLSWTSRIFGQERFLQPWMIALAGEHFQFDLTKTYRELGWQPTYRIQKKLNTILENKKQNPHVYRLKNQKRPWRPRTIAPLPKSLPPD